MKHRNIAKKPANFKLYMKSMFACER